MAPLFTVVTHTKTLNYCLKPFLYFRSLPADSNKEVTIPTFQPITWHQAENQSCLLTLITPSFSRLPVFVYLCVYRVFPHLESELCFPSGPVPMLSPIFLHSLFLQTSSPPPSLQAAVSCETEAESWCSGCMWAGYVYVFIYDRTVWFIHVKESGLLSKNLHNLQW